MSALRITKFVAATGGLMASGAWALSAMGDTFVVRSLLPWMTDPAVPKFQADMNAWAAGMASVAAFAQVFLTLRD
ncbi:hypothetical protein MKK63_24675 [Methylobacterium sp. J-088]|uniref:hypothetical protein n=1 Tax=Methylobacterium sp. J-088 TaxID=2836664 RepID=UPI001FB98117|nr:hypothetical protein [Methylobacterium sp. J-088]MCJ2065876.1 hypothetical protein [Methylobacterium sp. J-088]